MGSNGNAPRLLLARLADFFPAENRLTTAEVAALDALPAGRRSIRRGHNVIVQGHGYDALYALEFGFAMRYKVLSDGKRQVLHVAFPGDLLGNPACLYERALYSVSAITDLELCVIPFKRLARLFRLHPRLAMALYCSGLREAALHVEHIATLGQRRAYERVAHFVLEMSVRLRALGLCDGETFVMPLTQVQVADSVGLSAPHVSRMFGRLCAERLIELQGSRIRVLDRVALSALATFDDGYLAPASMPLVDHDGELNLFATHLDGARPMSDAGIDMIDLMRRAKRGS